MANSSLEVQGAVTAECTGDVLRLAPDGIKICNKSLAVAGGNHAEVTLGETDSLAWSSRRSATEPTKSNAGMERTPTVNPFTFR